MEVFAFDPTGSKPSDCANEVYSSCQTPLPIHVLSSGETYVYGEKELREVTPTVYPSSLEGLFDNNTRSREAETHVNNIISKTVFSDGNYKYPEKPPSLKTDGEIVSVMELPPVNHTVFSFPSLIIAYQSDYFKDLRRYYFDGVILPFTNYYEPYTNHFEPTFLPALSFRNPKIFNNIQTSAIFHSGDIRSRFMMNVDVSNEYVKKYRASAYLHEDQYFIRGTPFIQLGILNEETINEATCGLVICHSYGGAELAALEPGIPNLIIMNGQHDSVYAPQPMTGKTIAGAKLAVVGAYEIDRACNTITWYMPQTPFLSDALFDVGETSRYSENPAVISMLELVKRHKNNYRRSFAVSPRRPLRSEVKTAREGLIELLKDGKKSNSKCFLNKEKPVLIVNECIFRGGNENLVKELDRVIPKCHLFTYHHSIEYHSNGKFIPRPWSPVEHLSLDNPSSSLPLASGAAVYGGVEVTLCHPSLSDEGRNLLNTIVTNNYIPIIIVPAIKTMINSTPTKLLNGLFVVVVENGNNIDNADVSRAIKQQGPAATILIFFSETGEYKYWSGCDPKWKYGDLVADPLDFVSPAKGLSVVDAVTISKGKHIPILGVRGSPLFVIDDVKKPAEIVKNVKSLVSNQKEVVCVARQLRNVLSTTDMRNLQKELIRSLSFSDYDCVIFVKDVIPIVSSWNPNVTDMPGYLEAIGKFQEMILGEVKGEEKERLLMRKGNDECIACKLDRAERFDSNMKNIFKDAVDDVKKLAIQFLLTMQFADSRFDYKAVMLDCVAKLRNTNTRPMKLSVLKALMSHITEHFKPSNMIYELSNELSDVICLRDSYGTMVLDLERSVKRASIATNVAFCERLTIDEFEEICQSDWKNDKGELITSICVSMPYQEVIENLCHNKYIDWLPIELTGYESPSYLDVYPKINPRLQMNTDMIGSIIKPLEAGSGISLGFNYSCDDYFILPGVGLHQKVMGSLSAFKNYDFTKPREKAITDMVRIALRRLFFNNMSMKFKEEHGVDNPGSPIVGHVLARILLLTIDGMVINDPNPNSTTVENARTILFMACSVLSSGSTPLSKAVDMLKRKVYSGIKDMDCCYAYLLYKNWRKLAMDAEGSSLEILRETVEDNVGRRMRDIVIRSLPSNVKSQIIFNEELYTIKERKEIKEEELLLMVEATVEELYPQVINLWRNDEKEDEGLTNSHVRSVVAVFEKLRTISENIKIPTFDDIIAACAIPKKRSPPNQESSKLLNLNCERSKLDLKPKSRRERRRMARDKMLGESLGCEIFHSVLKTDTTMSSLKSVVLPPYDHCDGMTDELVAKTINNLIKIWRNFSLKYPLLDVRGIDKRRRKNSRVETAFHHLMLGLGISFDSEKIINNQLSNPEDARFLLNVFIRDALNYYGKKSPVLYTLEKTMKERGCLEAVAKLADFLTITGDCHLGLCKKFANAVLRGQLYNFILSLSNNRAKRMTKGNEIAIIDEEWLNDFISSICEVSTMMTLFPKMRIFTKADINQSVVMISNEDVLNNI